MTTTTEPVRTAGARWTALGCTVHLLVTDPALLAPARDLLEAELAALDKACSRFRTDSELSAVNRSAGRRVRVGNVLMGALRAALDAARATGGDVDPTVGGPLSDAGYDRDFAAVLASGCERAKGPTRVRVVRVPTWSRVELDDEQRTLRVPAGVELDLGATAKAWCADRSASVLHENVGCGVLVSLGGDIAARGPAPEGGWAVRVQEKPGPVEDAPSGPSCLVSIAGGGLATSSTTARRWRRGGRLMHHIIDPRTGMPAVGQYRTASVAAPTCLAANVQSTAAIVRSGSALERLAASGLPAWLVTGEGAVTVVNGWPGEVAA